MCAVCAIPRALNWSITILSTFHMRCYVYNTRLNIKMKNKYKIYWYFVAATAASASAAVVVIVVIY